MSLTLSNINMGGFGTSVLAGCLLHPCGTTAHFAAFLKCARDRPEYGTKAPSDISKSRKDSLLPEMRGTSWTNSATIRTNFQAHAFAVPNHGAGPAARMPRFSRLSRWWTRTAR